MSDTEEVDSTLEQDNENTPAAPEVVVPENKVIRLHKCQTSNISHWAAHCGMVPDACADWVTANDSIAKLQPNESLEFRGKNDKRAVVVTRLYGCTYWKLCVGGKWMFHAVKVDNGCIFYKVHHEVQQRRGGDPDNREARNALPHEAYNRTHIQGEITDGIIHRGFSGGASELFGMFDRQSDLEACVALIKGKCLTVEKPEEVTEASVKAKVFPGAKPTYLDIYSLHAIDKVAVGSHPGYSVCFDTVKVDAKSNSLVTSRGVKYSFSEEQRKAAIFGLENNQPVQTPWGTTKYSNQFVSIGCHKFLRMELAANLDGREFEHDEQTKQSLAQLETLKSISKTLGNSGYHTTLSEEDKKLLPAAFEFLQAEMPKGFLTMTAPVRNKIIRDIYEKNKETILDRNYTVAVMAARKKWNEEKVNLIAGAQAKYAQDLAAYEAQGDKMKWCQALVEGTGRMGIYPNVK